MKIILSLLAMIALQPAVSGQQPTNQGTIPAPAADPLVLKEKAYDFGEIQQGRPVKHNFEIINKNATDTLQLDDVHASCGCTTPVWKKGAVLPNESTIIEVGYNAAEAGPFEKTINLFYNGGKVKSLTIKGKVYKAAATSAPLNASIGLLKQKAVNQHSRL